MAGPASNFDSEIKKGMTGTKAKSSNGGTPTKTPTAGNKQNQWNQSSGTTAPQDNANGDTHARMIAAGQAHMQAIHDHINAMSGGGGGGGLAPVNAGTKA